ncbi:MAG: TonB-dependent receptor [Pseudomonadota bacterium]
MQWISTAPYHKQLSKPCVGKTALLSTTMRAAVLLSTGLMAATADAQDSDQGALYEEIFVTAQKREQKLLDVPLIVNTLSSDTIDYANIEDLDTLQNLIPGLTRDSNSIPRFSRTFIRGIGALQIATASDSSVGFYVDGVAVPRFAHGGRLFDIQQIEVLKGPQGTLYGRSAQGGVINITTKKPTDTFEATASAEYGSRNLVDVLGTISGPITDNLKFRAGAAYREQDGFLENAVNPEINGDTENLNIAASLFFAPSEDVAIEVGFQYLTDESEYPSQGAFLRNGERVTGRDSGLNQLSGYRIYGSVEWDLEFATLVSVTSYYDVENDLFGDDSDRLNFGPLDPVTESFVNNPEIDFSDWLDNETEFSEEVRLQGVADNGLDWLVGINLFVNDYLGNLTNNDLFTAGGLLDGVRNHGIERLGYAAFADFSYPLTDIFTVGGGLRYSREEQDLNLNYVPLNGNLPPFLELAPGFFFPVGTQVSNFDDIQSQSYDAFTGRVNIAAKITEGVRAFASYSRGHKPGAYPVFDIGTAIGIPITPLDETFINAFEVGIRGTSSDGRYSGSFALFFNDVKDEQVTSQSPLSPFAIIFENADVESFGAEFEAVLRPMDGLEIFANAAYIDSEITTATTNFPAGTQFPGVPEFTGGISVQYTYESDGGINVIPRIDYTHVGARTFASDFGVDGVDETDAYNLVNVSLTVAVNENVSLAVFGENIFDEDYALRGFGAQTSNAFLFGDPATWSVRLTGRF